jgi:hypothetical protein
MLGIDKIDCAQKILQKFLGDMIIKSHLDSEDLKITVELRNGLKLYIQYNNFNQYSYSIIFSKINLDRCRFDNYDKNWKLASNPHHFHPRLIKIANFSPMNGDPNKDIPLLCDLIRSGKLFLRDCQFFN